MSPARHSPPQPAVPGGVILLHGLGRTGLSMYALNNACKAAGHRTLAPSYGLRTAIPAILADLQPRIAEFAAEFDGPVHFITHSLGGLVVRALLNAERPANLGRVVMLAPPNAGSELVDTLERLGLDRIVLGPASRYLRTARPASAEARLGSVDFDLGIIAGDRAIDPILPRLLLPGANDGKVSVAATRIAGMRDHIVLPVQHTLMVADKRVIHQALAYLATGSFSR
ncbi:MAG: alpha/beta fold hydrolase [Sandarakinorhabdus sp.]|nr:alpha/beta fold hydrolase [Sandarakinorhabdus sp.]